MQHTLIDQTTTLFWFRRDLRLEDNAGLYWALKENQKILPMFIFDTEILDKLEDKADRRVEFIHQNLFELKNQLEELGSSLLVLHGNPIKIFKKLRPKNVYTNHDYEPYARHRDAQVKKILTDKGITFKTYKDQVIFDRDEVLKDDGTPYTVFTPYSKKWIAKLKAFYSQRYPTEKYFQHLKKVNSLMLPSLNEIGFSKTGIVFPERKIRLSIIEKYHDLRNFPAMQSTTRLSVHLRFGTVSIRKLVQVALKKNKSWLNELIWRDFYHMILWHFPQVEKSFKPSYDKIEWRNNPEEFQAWCDGQTGYPIVDRAARATANFKR